MTDQPIRWAVVGAGRFGTIHARVLSSIPDVELYGLCNRNEERLQTAASEFDGAHTFTDYEAILDDPQVDVVDITTHWQDHYPIALAALQRGKHVFLEKPMAASAEECRTLLQAAEEASANSKQCMVGHICRFDPRVTLAREAIDEGRIGRIVSMHAKRNLPKAPGSLRLDKVSPLMGDGIHDADLMMWFTGQTPSRVYGRNVRVDEFRYPDVGWAMLEFGEEAIGVVETNWRLPENTPTVIDAKLEVVGTEGMLTIDCSNPGLSVLDGSGLKMQDTVYWPMQHGQQIGALQHELAYFNRCVREGRTPEVVTPIEAARAVAVMEAAERSAVSGLSEVPALFA